MAGANDGHQLIFTFPSAVTFGNAAVTAGAGSVATTSGSGTVALVVNLTGVTNAQRSTVTLSNVSDGATSANVSIQLGILAGDTTGNGAVNSSDVGQTKANSGQLTTGTNFRTDVTINGVISASDIGLVKVQAGTALP
jgi:hypothetical protein